jgi:hypothetical protein
MEVVLVADMITMFGLALPLAILLIALGITLLGLRLKIPLITLIGALFSWVVFIDTIVTESGQDFILALIMLPITSMIVAMISFTRR